MLLKKKISNDLNSFLDQIKLDYEAKVDLFYSASDSLFIEVKKSVNSLFVADNISNKIVKEYAIKSFLNNPNKKKSIVYFILEFKNDLDSLATKKLKTNILKLINLSLTTFTVNINVDSKTLRVRCVQSLN